MADTNNKIKATFAFAFSCIIIIYSSFLDIPVLSRICLYAMCFVFTSLVSIGVSFKFYINALFIFSYAKIIHLMIHLYFQD